MKVKRLVEILEKYKKVSEILEVTKEISDIANIIDCLSNHIDKNLEELVENKQSSNTLKKNKDKDVFDQFIKDEENGKLDFDSYNISDSIRDNYSNIVNWWHFLSNKSKEKFKILELNIILYLISNEFNQYKNDSKKKLLLLISDLVKSKRMDASYNNIVV